MTENERLPDAEAPKKERKESGGEYLWRVLKPAGCVFVLLLFVVFLVFCFTYRNDPGELSAETAPPAATAVVNE